MAEFTQADVSVMLTLKCGDTSFIIHSYLKEWFEVARAGAMVTYAVGDLSHDRKQNIDPQGALNATANYALDLARIGYVELTQRKLGRRNYEYRMRKK